MKQAAIYWAAVAEPDFSAQRMAILPIRGDGERRDYTLRLTDNEAYRGMIQQLRIDPQAGGREGSKMVLHSVNLGNRKV